MRISGFTFTISHKRVVGIWGGAHHSIGKSWWAGCLLAGVAVAALAMGSPLVDASGSFNHSVSIALPAGTNGVQPDLDLNYSSSGGNGMLGMGWSLSGLPTITRINYGSGINYAGADTYAGPSGRLVDMGGGIFHSATEDWAKYVPTGACGYGPCQWTMYDAEGNTLEFGATADSRIEKVGSADVRVWAINRFTDPNGNSYEVTYSEDTVNGDYYPAIITYTKAVGISTYRTVEFAYEARTDVVPSYADGALEKMDQRLKWITVKSNGALVRKYRLDYQYGNDTGRSQLAAVQEYGSDDVSTLPAQTFAWLDGGLGFISGAYWGGSGRLENYYMQLGDFNGDNKSDIAVYSGAFPNAWAIYYSNGAGFNAPVNAGGGFAASNYMQLGDFNGDSKTDLAVYNGAFPSAWAIYYSNGVGFNAPVNAGGAARPENYYMQVIDFNGDGKTDLAVFGGAFPNAWAIYYANGVGFDAPVNAGGALRASTDMQFGDFNGDGKTDLAVFGTAFPGAWAIYYANGIGFNAPVNAGGASRLNYTRIGDINGDGKADLAVFGGAFAGAWAIYYSNGTGFNAPVNAGGAYVSTTNYTQFADFNGDSMIDLAVFGGPAYPSAWAIYFSNGTGFGPPKELGWGARSDNLMQFADFNGDGKMDYGVYSGVYQTAWSVCLTASSFPDFVYSTSNGLGSTTTVTYGRANQISGAVCPSAATPGCTGANVTNGNANSGGPLVTNVSTTDGRGATYSKSYAYFNGRTFPGTIPNRASLGFEWFKETDDQTGAYNVTYFRQDRPFHGRVDLTQGRTSTGVLISQSTEGTPSAFTCSEAGCAAGTADPIQIRSGVKTTSHYEMGTLLFSEAVTPTYDAYGNMTQKARVTYNSIGGSVRTSYELASFINETSVPRVIGLQYETKECVDAACASVLEFSRKYYDSTPLGSRGSRLLVTKKESFVDGTVSAPVMAVDTVLYDAYGNETIDTAANGLVTTVAYDTTFYAYPTSTTVPGNLTTTKAYDYRYGQATTTTSPDGASIVVTLDVFGRPTTIETKNGSTVLRKSGTGYSLTGAGTNGNWSEDCTFYGSGFSSSICSKTYQDGMGRTYRTEADGVTAAGVATKIASDTQFDAAGRPYRTSEPYYAGGTPSYWTTQTYDSAGQIISITHPNGGVTTLAYNDQALVAGSYSMKSSTDPLGKTTRQWFDDRGKVIRLEEGSPPLVVSYLYDDRGLLISVSDPRSNVTTLAYDAGGRRTSITTSDAGTITTTYNLTPGTAKFMTVNTETFPNPNASTGTITRTKTYDALGRPTGQTHSDGSSTSVLRYEEPTYSNWKGRITSTEHTEGGYTTTKQYAYNILGEVTDSYRIVKQGTTTLFTAHDRLNMDEMGRPFQRTYPDGTVVTQTFDIGGNVASIVLDGVTYATFSNYDVRSKVGTVTLANGVQTSYAYAANTGALATLAARKGTTTLLDEAYAFDTAGNVTQVTDNRTPSLTTTYTYDAYYRLTTAQRNSGQIFNFAFDNAGNITTKATLGNTGALTHLALTYNATNNRVVSDGTKSYTYSGAGNRVGMGTAGVAYATCPSGSTCYDYNSANMLRGVKNGSSVVLNNYYDGDQRRVLKIYTKPDGTKVKTYYLSEGFEIREIWSATNVLTDTKTTKYVMGIDDHKLASVTVAGVSLVAFNLLNASNNHYALAGMLATDSVTGVVLKSYHWLAAVVNDARVRDRALPAAGALCVLALLGGFISMAMRLAWSLKRKTGAFRAALALQLLAVLLMLSCVGDREMPADGDLYNGMLYGGQSALMSGDTSMGLPLGTYFYHADRLGSSASVTDATGAESTRIVYAPYGEVDQGYSTGNDIVTFKFTGQEYDPESALYNYEARFYDARLGTFTSADSIIPDGLSTQAFNRYMYVKGNPVTYTDPTGHYWVKRTWSTVKHWTTHHIRMRRATAYETQTRRVAYSCNNGKTCYSTESFRVSITVMVAERYTIAHSSTTHHASLTWHDGPTQTPKAQAASFANRRAEAERKYGKGFVKDACGSRATCNNVVNHTMDRKRVLHPPHDSKHPGFKEVGGRLHKIMEAMFGKEKPGSFMWRLGNGHDGFNEGHMAHDKTLARHPLIKGALNDVTAVEYTLVALGAGHGIAGAPIETLGRAVVHGTLQVGLNAGHVQDFLNTVTFGHASALEKALFRFSPAGQIVRAVHGVVGAAQAVGHAAKKACGWVHIPGC